MSQEKDAEYPSFGSSGVYKARGIVRAMTSVGERGLCCCVEAPGGMVLDVVDVVNMFLVSTIDLGGQQPIYAQYPSGAKSYSPALQSCSSTAYLLSNTSLKKVQITPWSSRVDKLIEQGEWLSGLSLCLSHYENAVKSSRR